MVPTTASTTIVDDLAAGRLVAPFALSVRKEQGWYLQYGNAAKNQPDFVAFMEWLRKEARVETERARTKIP